MVHSLHSFFALWLLFGICCDPAFAANLIGLYPTGKVNYTSAISPQFEFEYQSDWITPQSSEPVLIHPGALRLRNWECRWMRVDLSGQDQSIKEETVSIGNGEKFRLKCNLFLAGPYYQQKLETWWKQNSGLPPEGFFPSRKQQEACRPEVLLIPAAGAVIQSTHPKPSLLARIFGARSPVRLAGVTKIPTNIVMFMMDTMRSDHTPPYGHPFVLAPHIDMLASLGAVFTHSYGASSSTRPSVGSMFSGLQPLAHGAIRHATLGAFLHDGVPLLAESLRKQGLFTAGISSNDQVSAAYGFTRGFDFFKGSLWDSQVTPVALEQLKIIDEPFFLYLHYIAPHAPYQPPTQWKGLYQGLTKYEEQDEYCAEITADDRRVGEVLKELSKQGLLDRTLVWLVSDHGEEFWEHGWKEHGTTVYEESVQTVSIVMYPEFVAAGRRIAVPVTHADMYPTFTDLFRWEQPTFSQGMSLLPLLQGKEDVNVENRPLFLHHGGGLQLGPHFSDKSGILLGKMKLICWDQKEEWEFYDLSQDSAEKMNLLAHGNESDAEREAIHVKMEQLLLQHREACHVIADYYTSPDEMARTVELSPREIENLTDLGYMANKR
ncbi:MAG: DUF4976 domain-containing protein [Candidatus Omnitrophota bacterium]|jgi:arylsulfatase A-like enzyme|nr:MAG: DUF4976 domain-containing protein [Candidatus Omnitrophota bacterium]